MCLTGAVEFAKLWGVKRMSQQWRVNIQIRQQKKLKNSNYEREEDESEGWSGMNRRVACRVYRRIPASSSSKTEMMEDVIPLLWCDSTVYSSLWSNSARSSVGPYREWFFFPQSLTLRTNHLVCWQNCAHSTVVLLYMAHCPFGLFYFLSRLERNIKEKTKKNVTKKGHRGEWAGGSFWDIGVQMKIRIVAPSGEMLKHETFFLSLLFESMPISPLEYTYTSVGERGAALFASPSW